MFQVPTGISLPSDLIEVTFPGEFDISAMLVSDMSMRYGPGASTAGVALLAPGSGGVGTWGVGVSGNTFIFSPPSDAGVGTIPAGDWIHIYFGRVTGATTQLVTPASEGVYQIFVGGDFFADPVAISTLILDNDTLQVTATVPDSTPVVVTPPSTGGTGGPFDTASPVITNLRAENITTVAATILWNTNESASGYLEYGLTTSYSAGNSTVSTFATGQSVTLAGLLPDTTYHVRVRAQDVAGNISWSGDLTFRTASTAVFEISDLRVTYVDDHRAMIEWTTNQEAIGGVTLLTPTTATILENVSGRSHVVNVGGLVPGTSYTFRVNAATLNGRSAEANGTFITTIDRTPPANVSDFRGVLNAAERTVELRWTNPTDSDFSRVIITRQDSAGGTPVLVCITVGTSCSDRLPTSGTVFIYRAVAEDATGNASSGAIVSITTGPPPVVPPPTELPDTTTPLPAPPTEPTLPGPAPSEPATVAPTTSPGTGTTPTTPVIPGEGSVLPPISGPGGVDVSETPTSTDSVDPSQGGGDLGSLELLPEFFLSETLPALPDSAGVRAAVVGRALQVRLSIIEMNSSLAQAQIELSGGSIYQLSYRSTLGAYVADFTFDRDQIGQQTVLIRARSADGRSWERSYRFDLIPPAQVVDADNQTVLSLATTTVAVIPLDPIGPTVFAEVNSTNDYAFLLPNGRYRLRVLGRGYRPYEETVEVTRGILAESVRLRPQFRSFSDLAANATSVSQLTLSIVEELGSRIATGVEALRAPEIQTVTQNIVAPAVVVATVGATTAAVSGFALLNYLRFLFTQPLLLIGRRKRKSWGVVYNSLSKQPIELAIVRLMRPGTSFAIQTHITDAQGRFSFLAPIGAYTIQVQKPGYKFPTEYLKEEKIDVDFTDLYHGEKIEVTEKTSISPNIPLDPIVKEELPKAIIRKRFLRNLQSALGVVGIGVSFIALFILPSWQMLAFAVFQIASYAIFRRLAIPAAPKRWGIVYEPDGKRPLSKAVIRIFDKKFNKLLETQITEKDGTYGFFAAKGVYYLTADKPGYERYQSADVDLRQSKDTYIDYKFSLKQATPNPQ